MSRHQTDQKFSLSEKKHIESTAHLNGSQLLDSVNSSETSLVIGEGSRTHFEPRYGVPIANSTVKLFPPKQSGRAEDLAHGKKHIQLKESNPIEGGSPKVPEKRHLLDKALQRSEESDRITVDWTSRNIPKMDSGHARNQLRSDEYNLTDTMTRKKGVPDELHRRNFIPTSVPGDKSYRVPEHSFGFYAEPGLIPGSTIVKRKSGKPQLQKREETSTVKKTINSMTYEEKVARDNERYEQEQVRLLNNGSSSMGRPVPSWEERTGQYIVKPEDEAD